MRGGIFGGAGLIVIAIAALVAYLSVFIVDPTKQALVLRLGDPVRIAVDPGVYFKVPLIDHTVFIEKRILDLDSPPLEIIASDQKRLVVDAFGRFRIFDPLKFYQTYGTINVAETQLSQILNSSVRGVLGEASFIALVREQRQALMQRISEQVNTNARAFGIDIVDVKIRRADLPEANSQAIYQRMQTERQRQAAEIRAQGDQAANRIRAQADREATVIVAEANKSSEQIRGDGDAAVNKIYADAFNQDPEFFAFYRSMEAYRTGLRSDDTRLVVAPESQFFDYFANSKGRPAENEAAATPPPNAGPASGAAVPAPAR